jgi:uncharacterized protein (TIRG00374 family)
LSVRVMSEPLTVPSVHAHRDHVRSPVDVLRLVVALGLIGVGLLVANLFDTAFLGLSDDGQELTSDLPSWANEIPTVLLAVTVATAILGALAWTLVTTRFRRFALLAGGFLLAAGLSVVVGEILTEVIDDDVWEAFAVDDVFLRYRDGGGSLLPGDPLLAGAIAMLGLSSSFLPRLVSRRLAILVGGYAVVSTLTSGVPAQGLLTDIGVGLVSASVLLLIFGRHDLAPDELDILRALHSVGLEFEGVAPLAVDARGSAPWSGTTIDGERVFVKALGRDQRSADLLFRLYRWLRLRTSGDRLPFTSLRQAVEREALVSLQAAALGVQTPRIVGVAEAGVDGMVLAYEAIEGRSADNFTDIDDEALIATWRMVSLLHSKRIAHRDLRLANIFLDTSNEAWLIDFGFSELAASDQLLGTDVAELLASTAAVVGTERAVAAAHQATGLDELERALPWLQPAALSSATRQAINGDRGLEPIRRMLIDQCGVPEEPPFRLQRVEGRTIFILATVALSAWFLFPQLADVDNIWRQVREASLPWALAAVAFSLITYLGATASLLGAIPARLRFGGALLAQLASSFANRVTPAKVGGVATNIRYFQKQGVPTAVGVTAVGLNAVAGAVVHISMTLGFLLLSSQSEDTGSLTVPSPRTLGLAVAVVGLVLAVSATIPRLRALMRDHVIPQLRSGVTAIRTLGRDPWRLFLLFGGSAAITIAYLAAMTASLEAFGANISFPLLALLFLTGSAVANAAPTPGGLGAAEAALIAAFSTVEEAEIVIPAVFLYRLVTFWLPIFPGWLALVVLRRRNAI